MPTQASVPGSASRPGAPAALELVGIAEVAERLAVERKTVDQWRRRGIFPEPDWPLAGGPVWRWSTVASWARRSGRL